MPSSKRTSLIIDRTSRQIFVQSVKVVEGQDVLRQMTEITTVYSRHLVRKLYAWRMGRFGEEAQEKAVTEYLLQTGTFSSAAEVQSAYRHFTEALLDMDANYGLFPLLKLANGGELGSAHARVDSLRKQVLIKLIKVLKLPKESLSKEREELLVELQSAKRRHRRPIMS